jgi:hypothetical protein
VYHPSSEPLPSCPATKLLAQNRVSHPSWFDRHPTEVIVVALIVSDFFLFRRLRQSLQAATKSEVAKSERHEGARNALGFFGAIAVPYVILLPQAAGFFSSLLLLLFLGAGVAQLGVLAYRRQEKQAREQVSLQRGLPVRRVRMSWRMFAALMYFAAPILLEVPPTVIYYLLFPLGWSEPGQLVRFAILVASIEIAVLSWIVLLIYLTLRRFGSQRRSGREYWRQYRVAKRVQRGA